MEKITFMTSLLTFYLKGEIKAEQNFLKLKKPNTIFTLIPLGARKINVPINQISLVGTNFKLFVKDLFIGIVELIASFAMFKATVIWALILMIVGAITIINSFQTELVISTTSGANYWLFFLIFEKRKAEAAAEAINNMIGSRLYDTNVRIHSENQTAAINSAQSENTQAIINAINSNNKNG